MQTRDRTRKAHPVGFCTCKYHTTPTSPGKGGIQHSYKTTIIIVPVSNKRHILSGSCPYSGLIGPSRFSLKVVSFSLSLHAKQAYLTLYLAFNTMKYIPDSYAKVQEHKQKATRLFLKTCEMLDILLFTC